MPQPNTPCSTAIFSSHLSYMVTKKQFIKYFLPPSAQSGWVVTNVVRLITVGLTASILIGCSDLSTQSPTTVPSTNTGLTTQSQSLEKTQSPTQNTPSEQPPEPRSVWVTLANMRCH